MLAHNRGMIATLVMVLALGFGLGGCKVKRKKKHKKKKVNCGKLCKRMSNCALDISLLQGKMDKKTFKAIKADAAARKPYKKSVRKYCKKRCKKNNKKKRWGKSTVKGIKGCLKKDGCTKFASCIIPYLY